MLALGRDIETFAPHDVPILIRGESGTGKELVAQAICRVSRRRERPFKVVNCGALARELLLSQLFGHERGAFTGAVTQRRGTLALADGGTVFLDEVGELLPEAQVALLRFLQEGTIEPVGSSQPIQVDVRIIAATHRDLEGMVASGSFREDLYYRLRWVVFKVPPLRERREDIPVLAEHFRVAFNARFGLAVAGFSPMTMALLHDYPWPGNVRDLEAVVARAAISRASGVIEPEDLAMPGRPAPGAKAPGRRLGRAPDGAESLTWPAQEALRMAAARGEVRRADVMQRCGVSRELARRTLVDLVRQGLLRRIGVGRGRGIHYVRLRARAARSR